MIKVALEDALMKLKDHFHGEKRFTAGLFHHTQTQIKTINQTIHTKIIRIACCISLYKKEIDNTDSDCGTTACLQAHFRADGT